MEVGSKSGAGVESKRVRCKSGVRVLGERVDCGSGVQKWCRSGEQQWG